MKKYFRYVDRRLALALLLTVGIFFAVNAIWVRGVNNGLERDRAAKAEAEKELNELRSRISDIRADGVSSAEELLTRLQRIEGFAPFGAGDIELTRPVLLVAAQAGVTLEKFQISTTKAAVTMDEKTGKDVTTEEKAKDPSLVSGLKSVRYDFRITGTYGAVLTFMEQVLAAPNFIATMDSVVILPSANSDNPTIFDELVSAEGVISLWTSQEKHLSTSNANDADEQAAPPATPTPAPAAPGSTNPASLGTATTVPSQQNAPAPSNNPTAPSTVPPAGQNPTPTTTP